MMPMPQGINLSMLAIFALCVGSFLNVVIYRLPLMLETNDSHKFNLCIPRSHCPKCKKILRIRDNIPILSFMLLKGRTNCCKHKISWQYPLVEAAATLLALLSGVYFGINSKLIFILLFLWMNLAISVIDARKQIIPDGLSLSLLWLGLVANSYGMFTTLNDAVFAAIIAYLSLWLFINCYYLITKKIGMGHGDFKLFAALGAWFGIYALPQILFYAATIGAIYGISYCLITRKHLRLVKIPFGPFLSVAGAIILVLTQR
jgi:leader peptidase (prepilin peptidase) / N-methyltransferase